MKDCVTQSCEALARLIYRFEWVVFGIAAAGFESDAIKQLFVDVNLQQRIQRSKRMAHVDMIAPSLRLSNHQMKQTHCRLLALLSSKSNRNRRRRWQQLSLLSPPKSDSKKFPPPSKSFITEQLNLLVPAVPKYSLTFQQFAVDNFTTEESQCGTFF
jgi:hypothetical protein